MNEEITEKTQTLAPFTKLCMTIGQLPSSYFESMSYYEQLIWFTKYLQEQVIPAVNQNAAAVEELQRYYIELQNYVNNYFDNLDVQQEINNKLDEMAGDGSLTNLIKAYVDPIYQAYTENINEQIQAQNVRINAISSGSPLAASSTAGMTDTSRIYVNTTDGYWYYYNGSAWTQGGVYQASVSSIDSYTRNMFKNFINILDTLCEFVNVVPSITWEEGYFYDTSGVKTQYANAKCSVLNVTPGDMYYITGYNATTGRVYNLLDGTNAVIETPSETGYQSYFVIIPDNATSMQISAITNRVYSIKKVTSMILSNSQIQEVLTMYSVDYQAKNLIENATYENNKIWNNIGDLVDYNDFLASEKIEIPARATKLTLASSKPTTLMILFDENENFVRKIDGISMQSEDTSKEVTLADNEKYFAINIYKENLSVQKVTCDSLFELVNHSESNEVDVFIFMGQSNMTGQGNPSLAPELIDGAGYEYSSSLDVIYPITEPAGENDNQACNGSLITAFANAYYTEINVPIVECMCAVSGSGIDEWQPNGTYLTRAITYLENCISYLTRMGYRIRHKNMVWLQGEHEGNNGSTGAYYKEEFNTMFEEMKDNGIENCFLIRIGEYNGSGKDFSAIIQAQTELCQDDSTIIMATTTLCSMADRDMMNDQFHMNQLALNEAGTYAGINSALFIRDNKEPTMYDYKYDNLYYSHIN